MFCFSVLVKIGFDFNKYDSTVKLLLIFLDLIKQFVRFSLLSDIYFNMFRRLYVYIQ